MAFQALAVQLGVKIGMWGLGKLQSWLDPEPKLPKPNPEGLQFGQAEVGSPVPIVYGTVRIDSPVIVGIWNAEALYDENGATANGVPANAYAYGATMLLVLGMPMRRDMSPAWTSVAAPTFNGFWYGDAFSTVSGDITHGNNKVVKIKIDGDQFLDHGDFIARAEFFDGREDQAITNYPLSTPLLFIDQELDEALADRSLVPGYRKQMVLALIARPSQNHNVGAGTQFGGFGGHTPRISSISVEVRARGNDGIGTSEANPAWVMFDMLCAPEKLNISQDLVDYASFAAAASTLTTESHGCSVIIQRIEDAPRVFSALLDQIDGVMFENESTGKIKLKLIRNDYVVADLPEMTIDNTIGRPEVTWVGWRSTVNTLRVHYTDRTRGYKSNTVTAQRLANAVGQRNTVKTADFDAPGCTTEALAKTIANRELSVVGRPLMMATASVNRFFHDLEIGDPVLCNWPAIDIVDKVFRVLEVDKGQHADGAIRVSLIEDVFDA